MSLLSATINTLPGTSSFVDGSENPKSLAFVVYLGEGQEESLYLEMLAQGKDNIIDVFKYYLDSKKQISLSHPNHRYSALVEFLDKKDSDFSPVLDKAFLISDRDNQSFKEKQYDEMLEKCRNKNIEWIVSNPSFQLWLLFHFTDDIIQLELEKIPRSKIQIQKVEDRIKTLSGRSYEHGTIKKVLYQPLIDAAIKNSERYCLPVEKLKDHIGTNFSILVKYILDESH